MESSFLGAQDQEVDHRIKGEEAAKRASELAIANEIFMPDDYDIVSGHIEEFMHNLYGTGRYADHNDRILAYYDEYSAGSNAEEADPEAAAVDRMTIILHDFVEHTILSPEKTAAKLGRAPEEAENIRSDALEMFNNVLSAVDDQDGLVKAYLFTIDMSKWESEARIWRHGATSRIAEMLQYDKITLRDAEITRAAVNKTPELDTIDKDELEAVLKNPDHRLDDLKLGAISVGTLKHNIKGLFFKGWETLDLIEHPPANNPASTYRDCTETMNFFVPALMALGYKKLAIDLRDAALQWFFEDQDGHAAKQHELSQQYFDDIQAKVTDLQEVEFGGIEVITEGRVKSEGSLREKLASEDYEGIFQTPDGVGLAFIVPDDMAGEEMEQFGEEFRKKLAEDAQIVPGHPNPTESSFDNMQGEKRRKSGYEAVHMTFYYYPEADQTVPEVPFEIQILTKQQHRLKTYGRSSDLFYKAGATYSEHDQPHLQHLEERARAERELAPGSTVQSVAEMVSVSPEIPSVYNKLFRAVDRNGTRILVPPQLERAVHELPIDALPAPGSLAVIPPRQVRKTQFLEAISLYGRDLADDKNILNAIKLIQESEAGNVRDDGITSVMEGHILPTALTAVMLATQSGKIWGQESGPIEHISNIATIALLHDYVENELDAIENQDVKTATRQSMIFEIKQKFGRIVADGVNALTIPFEVEGEFERREQYARNIRENEYALLIKPADRWQNHTTDLIKLASGRVSVASPEGQKIMAYFAKTDRHLSEIFTSADLPEPYARVHKIIWNLAKQAGYKQSK